MFIYSTVSVPEFELVNENALNIILTLYHTNISRMEHISNFLLFLSYLL